MQELLILITRNLARSWSALVAITEDFKLLGTSLPEALDHEIQAAILLLSGKYTADNVASSRPEMKQAAAALSGN